MIRVLLADHDETFRRSAADALKGERCLLSECSGAGEALVRLKREPFDVVLTELCLKGMSSADVLRQMRARVPGGTLVVLDGPGSIAGAFEALQSGAQDYIAKPVDPQTLLRRLGPHLRQKSADTPTREDAPGTPPAGAEIEIVGTSRSMMELHRLIAKVASSESTVLIRGETGTGKELVARALHRQSPRRDRPFILVDCSAVPEALLERRLFGPVPETFAGADPDPQGLFSAGGTIFLDEVDGIPLSLQPKVLRALDAREFALPGSPDSPTSPARVIAATNRDLKALAESGQFRHDLYFRLSTIEIPIPPLRARPEDIAITARYLISRLARRMGRPIPDLSPAALSALERHDWPGNVRELANVVERAMILNPGGILQADGLPQLAAAAPFPAMGTLSDARKAFEHMFAARVLASCDGDKARAARILDISLTSLYRKLHRPPPAAPDSD